MTWEQKPSLTRTNEEIKIRVLKSVRRKPALLGDLCIRKHFASDTKVASEDDVVTHVSMCVASAARKNQDPTANEKSPITRISQAEPADADTLE